MSNLLASDHLKFSANGLTENEKQEQFLRLHLEPETKIILPIQQLTEVLRISQGAVVPIPQMPSWVIGVYNWRGEILWMVDLGQLIGLHSWQTQQLDNSNYTVVVISETVSGSPNNNNSEQKTLGLIVPRIEDLEWCDPNSIQSPPGTAVTPEIAPFLWGYWLKPNGEMLLALNGNAIIETTSQL